MRTPPNQLLDEIVTTAQTNQQDPSHDVRDEIIENGLDVLIDNAPDIIDAGSSALDWFGALLEGLFSI